MDDEYEDEDQWEEGAEDILEKGEQTLSKMLLLATVVLDSLIIYVVYSESWDAEVQFA